MALAALQGSSAARRDVGSSEGALGSVGSRRATWPTSVSGSRHSGVLILELVSVESSGYLYFILSKPQHVVYKIPCPQRWLKILFNSNILHVVVLVTFLAGRMSALAKAEVITRGRFGCKCL